MDQVAFANLKVGDVVFDTISRNDLKVAELRPPSHFESEHSIRFERIECVTIYAHGANTLKQYIGGDPA